MTWSGRRLLLGAHCFYRRLFCLLRCQFSLSWGKVPGALVNALPGDNDVHRPISVTLTLTRL